MNELDFCRRNTRWRGVNVDFYAAERHPEWNVFLKAASCEHCEVYPHHAVFFRAAHIRCAAKRAETVAAASTATAASRDELRQIEHRNERRVVQLDIVDHLVVLRNAPLEQHLQPGGVHSLRLCDGVLQLIYGGAPCDVELERVVVHGASKLEANEDELIVDGRADGPWHWWVRERGTRRCAQPRRAEHCYAGVVLNINVAQNGHIVHRHSKPHDTDAIEPNALHALVYFEINQPFLQLAHCPCKINVVEHYLGLTDTFYREGGHGATADVN